jgi:hypothetical protein
MELKINFKDLAVLIGALASLVAALVPLLHWLNPHP